MHVKACELRRFRTCQGKAEAPRKTAVFKCHDERVNLRGATSTVAFQAFQGLAD